MANLSQIKREQMIKFLEKLKAQHSDDDSLIAINQIERELTAKKYGLVWEEHSEKVEEMMRESIPVFTEEKEREVLNDLSNSKFNFLLEGDNLHSLLLLEKAIKGNVDIIYIDPPYNTGSQDWKYNNDYVDDNDTYRHSKWISMMYKRLLVAKKLLSPEGALICAIDDNEQANLMLVLDDLFGLSHDITCVTVVHNPRGTQANKFSYVSEYAIFVTPKNVLNIEKRKMRDEEVSWRSLRRTGDESLRTDAKNCFFPIYVKDHSIVGFGDVCDEDFHPGKASIKMKDGTIAVYPIDPNGVERKWGYARQTIEDIKEQLRPKEVRGTWDISIGYIYVTQRTVWDSAMYDANAYGTQLLGNILNTSFPFPKSLYLVEDCLSAIVQKKDAVILDFFAGSGTTGHAVLDLNQADGGNRRFILCTNNEISALATLEYMKECGHMLDYTPAKRTKATAIENAIQKYLVANPGVEDELFGSYEAQLRYNNHGICRQVTYNRIKTVITGMKKDGTFFSKGIPANLKYYRTEFVNKKSEELVEDLSNHVVEMIQLQYGIQLDGQEYVLILSDEEMDEFEKNMDSNSRIQALFISQDILLSKSQELLIEELNTYIIPDYYFDFELREAGEIW